MVKRAGKKKHRDHGARTSTVTNSQPVASSQVDAPVTPDQETLQQSQTEPLDGSWFWPELSADLSKGRDGEPVSPAKAAVIEEQRKRIWEFRAEIQAVKSGFPIPASLKARMVFEAAKTMMNPAAGQRERLAANKLLVEMEKANRGTGDLPDQLAPTTTNNIQVNVAAAPTPEPSATVQEIVSELLSMPAVQDAIDLYEFKAQEGEDYAS